ncbi:MULTISPECIES: lytic transglycosylase domain-containing protein [Halorhodospira]|uniref:lytic transglycosylase domain-containing protein n=1 Tax=Halorhodospira TaxID=85108 RepID=UPI001EE8D67D|nr:MULTISPECIES: lytic transglycosylase domain-containing protein [Halorhodospira]MCG5526787.1 lytic transglycosylase domain-containing protein [Halorhodospira halophila]MCG5542876.1 lytic transglycosylase domain-containing protein [Halorhodospira sp. 9628]
MRMHANWLIGGCGLVFASLGAYHLHHSPWAAERGAAGADCSEQLERLRASAGMPEVSRAVVETIVEDRQAERDQPVGSNRAIPREHLDELIDEAAEVTGLSADLIRAVVRTESDYRPGVVSSAGAVGLMQVRPMAAVDVGERVPEWLERFGEREGLEIEAEDLADPRLNILLGSHYLAHLHERYASYGEPMATWLALAAYNWGPGNVYRNLLSNPNLQNLEDLRWLLHRRAPYETRAFIDRVLERSGKRAEEAGEAI